jgi:purine-binding chemotaxis protein CheW
MTDTSDSFLSFRVGPEWYGVDVDYITEVLHLVGLTELPGTAPDVLGLLTLRDSVMPVVDLRLRFNLPDAHLKLDTPIIAMRTTKGALGIVVDDVDDVEIISGVMDYQGDETRYVKGVIRQDDKLVLLLDVDELYAETSIADIPIPETAKPGATPQPESDNSEGDQDQ